MPCPLIALSTSELHEPHLIRRVQQTLTLLNVSRGGTLIQDLPSRRPSDVLHRQEEPGTEPTHGVRVEPDSALATALQAVEVAVNTFHHQAVDRLGEGLRPVAWAPDGLVEGIEDPDQRFVVGVQWHAESLRALPEQRALFAAFTAAAAARRPSMAL